MGDFKFFEENPGSDQFSDDEDEDSSINQSPSPSQVSSKIRDGMPSKRPKLTRGKQKIPISFMQDRVRRCSTFSKRKAGLMKKAFELAELTGAEVLLLVASETNHVYTFTTNRLKTIIESDQGRELIQSCLGSRGQNNSNTDSSTTAPSPLPQLPTQDSSPEQPQVNHSQEITNGHGEIVEPPCLPAEPQQQTLSIQMIDGTMLHLPVNFPNSGLVLPLLSSQTVGANEAIASLLCQSIVNGENQTQNSESADENASV
ncbi:hypothetical protein Aperf_G00000080840 [Anoplocephala perfoliata]